MRDAVHELGRRDADLAAVVERHGPPPLWAREPGFPTLVLLVLEQQVSLASARAAFDRLVAVTGPPTPDTVLRLDDAELRSIGFSRQKAGYARDLASALLTRRGVAPAPGDRCADPVALVPERAAAADPHLAG